MARRHDFFPLAMWVAGLGTLLVFAAAMEPLASIGYRLRGEMLLTGLTPYLVYGLGAWLQRGALLLPLGGALLAGDVWLRVAPALSYLTAPGDAALYLWAAAATALVALVYWLAPPYREG